MKLYIFVILLIFQGFYCAFSQSFVIKRTDVMDAEATFVTATYNFSYEIYLDGVPNSNSVSFRLVYTNSDNIKFSQWKKGDFDVLQAVNRELEDNNAELIIGVSSGLTPQPENNTMPKVIELEFVVLKSAVHETDLRMTFERPVATAIDSGIGRSVPISAEGLNFRVHSFVQVWPGDTDNNGIVDHLDFVPVSQYIGMGSATKGFKSFKRQASSALWAPQRVLAWDSAAVTFADCDGNGDITTSDMLIVTYNLGKDKTKPHGSDDGEKISQDIYKAKIFSNENTVLYPVNVSAIDDFTGVAGYIELTGNHKFLGIETGEMLPENNYLHFFQNDNIVTFVSGNSQQYRNTKSQGNLVNLVFEKINSDDSYPFVIRELNAISDSGLIFSLSGISSVKNSIYDIVFSINNDILTIESPIEILNLKIYDNEGKLLTSEQVRSQNYNHNIGNYYSGIYFIHATTLNGEIRKKFSIVR